MSYATFILRCEDCWEVMPEYNARLNEHGDRTCFICSSERLVHHDARNARWVSVAAHTVERAYGGPEEGGWHYRQETLIPESSRCFVFDNWTKTEPDDEAKIEAYKELLKARYGTGPHISIHIRSEGLPPSRLPEVRPVYC